MIKRTTKESIKEYDANGCLIKEIVTETQEDDDTIYLCGESLSMDSSCSRPTQI